MGWTLWKRSEFLSSLPGRTKIYVRADLAEGPFLLWHHAHACPDSPLSYSDRLLLKLLERVSPTHFSFSLPLSPKFSFSHLGFYIKTLDIGRLKPPNSNLTPETWSLLQDLCFHRLVWGKSENPSSSRFCVDFWEFEFNLSIFSRFCVFWSILDNFQVLGCILVRKSR
jgi:hypothetical protein